MKFVLSVPVLSLLSILTAADDYPLKDTVECQARGGIPNFVAKLKAGKEVKSATWGEAEPGAVLKFELNRLRRDLRK